MVDGVRDREPRRNSRLDFDRDLMSEGDVVVTVLWMSDNCPFSILSLFEA